ncbi:succinyldiaminopimelate transaminase [Bifidobacterium sp. W8109]|uniref:succinyldiaminopimelate transaminase n=1 Tax=Bifidobacterium TaxID=1678 RepID=UPI0018DDE5CE|nr:MULTISPECIES: succinyldiaminopimelate transaminase [Bifidobacterium]MBH9971035.1 succinyldiaminopimelate transaminase [Bifidobacterium asteroides]MBI0072642.1 succinyldiaminopimelate transaminase [Bifidobacterium sp. W8110]
MGFHSFESPYDWSRIDPYRRRAEQCTGGLVDLSVGSPVDSVPRSVKEALAAAADDGQARGYPKTAGDAPLRQAAADWFRHRRRVDLDALGADLVPTVGSKEAVALMASLLHLGPGDRVVQPTVSYPTYAIGTQLAGAQVTTVDDPVDTDSWVNLPGVRAIWINSPGNPSGRIIGRAGLAKIVRAARSIGVTVLSDECYALLDWSGPAQTGRDAQIPASPCILESEVCGGDASGILCLYSMSKQSNMAGYRAALVAGDARLVEAMTAYRKQMGLIVPGPVQRAMRAALEDGEAVMAQRGVYASRLHALAEALRSYGYDAVMPQGGLYIWAQARSGDCWADMADLSRLGILASPGEFYGDGHYLRFSSTITDEQLELALGRLRSAA